MSEYGAVKGWKNRIRIGVSSAMNESIWKGGRDPLLNSFSVETGVDIEKISVIGSRQPVSIVEGVTEVSGSLERNLYSKNATYNEFIYVNDTTHYDLLKATGLGGEEGLECKILWNPLSNDPDDGYKRVITNVKFHNYRIAHSARDIVAESVDYDASRLHIIDKQMIRIIGTNTTLSDYQIKIELNASNFDFIRTFKDGSDIYFTDKNGSEIPHWIEIWSNNSAIIWCKVPSIPANTSTHIWMVYGDVDIQAKGDGDATFEFFDDFRGLSSIRELKADNASSYKIATTGYLAENIVYDSVTSKYWWVFEDRSVSPSVIRLASATDIDGPWTVEANPVISETGHSLNSPCIVKFDDYWYIYYGRDDDATPSPSDIYVQKSSSVNSGYSASGITNPILTRGNDGEWDSRRVLEPYVFKENNTYYLFYMGEDTTNLYEKTGYAISSSPTGPFTKYAGNPVLSGDSPSGWNGGQDKAADPFVFKKDGIFYIGITACESDKTGWTIGFFKTTDFINFSEVDHNPILRHGEYGSWDDSYVLRGAVSEFSGIFYFPYTGYDGFSYRMGMTTLQFDVEVAEIDQSKWTITGSPNIRRGILITEGTTHYVTSKDTFGQNFALRSRSKLHALEPSILGFRNYSAGEVGLQFIANYPNSIDVRAYQHVTEWVNSTDLADPNVWATYEVVRNDDISGIYFINNIEKAELTTQVPLVTLPVTLLKGTIADWILVRKYADPEPTVII